MTTIAKGKDTMYRPTYLDLTDEELAETGNIKFDKVEEQRAPGDDKKARHSHMNQLQRLLEKEKILSDAAMNTIVHSPPLISRGDAGIIGRSTVNIIQGAFGSHKSRLAELLASLMLTTNNKDEAKFLEFKRAPLERFCVCYIDTERNLTEELPYAVQGIKTRAGYRLDEKPEHFRFTSIKGEDRKDRFNAIETFIHHVREQTSLHLFCLIDVVTDAIGDFNDPKESMKLFDFLGNLCDSYSTTFLLVIHQNPGTEKARGHTGTEAANKASTAMQIGFKRDANGQDTNLIRLKYIKMRRGKRPDSVYLQFDTTTNGLILADASLIADAKKQRVQKADEELIIERLLALLSVGPLPKKEVWVILEKEFNASNSTVRGRLKSIMDEQPAMLTEDGTAVRLGEKTEGRDQFFQLVLLD